MSKFTQFSAISIRAFEIEQNLYSKVQRALTMMFIETLFLRVLKIEFSELLHKPKFKENICESGHLLAKLFADLLSAYKKSRSTFS